MRFQPTHSRFRGRGAGPRRQLPGAGARPRLWNRQGRRRPPGATVTGENPNASASSVGEARDAKGQFSFLGLRGSISISSSRRLASKNAVQSATKTLGHEAVPVVLEPQREISPPAHSRLSTSLPFARRLDESAALEADGKVDKRGRSRCTARLRPMSDLTMVHLQLGRRNERTSDAAAAATKTRF